MFAWFSLICVIVIMGAFLTFVFTYKTDKDSTSVVTEEIDDND